MKNFNSFISKTFSIQFSTIFIRQCSKMSRKGDFLRSTFGQGFYSEQLPVTRFCRSAKPMTLIVFPIYYDSDSSNNSYWKSAEKSRRVSKDTRERFI